MRLALVLMFTNELPFLRLHLPVFKDSFAGIVAITDPKTTDGSLEYMQSIGAHVIVDEWRYNWGDFATKVFNEAERLGYDAACRVDGDECLFPTAANLMCQKLENEATLLVLPRHEFAHDRLHVRGDIYPDGQARCWRLRCGIVVQGFRHEGVSFGRHNLSEHTLDPDYRVLRPTEPDIHLFHYSWIGDAGIMRNMRKYQSHAQVTAGGPPEVNFPPDIHPVKFDVVPFMGEQPLSPDVCGPFAPFGPEYTR